LFDLAVGFETIVRVRGPTPPTCIKLLPTEMDSEHEPSSLCAVQVVTSPDEDFGWQDSASFDGEGGLTAVLSTLLAMRARAAFKLAAALEGANSSSVDR
jgi:hypothetical protein